MALNSITGSGAAFVMPTPMKPGPSEKTAKSSTANELSANPAVKSVVVDVAALNKDSAANKQVPVAGSDAGKQPAPALSNVVEVYNLQGKLRTKFMDSHNNVVYQVPSEMVAKMEDQMMKPDSTTNVKG